MEKLSSKRPNFCDALQNQIEHVWDFGNEKEVRTTARGGAEFLHKRHMLRIQEAKHQMEALQHQAKCQPKPPIYNPYKRPITNAAATDTAVHNVTQRVDELQATVVKQGEDEDENHL